MIKRIIEIFEYLEAKYSENIIIVKVAILFHGFLYVKDTYPKIIS